MPKFLVDNKEIEAKQGTTLLKACLDNQIYIPNLCYLESIDPPSVSCRMCFVEIEGERQPVPSCTVLIKDDMVVKTDTPAVRQLQRTALRLLLSVHHVDCKNCQANKTGPILFWIIIPIDVCCAANVCMCAVKRTANLP